MSSCACSRMSSKLMMVMLLSGHHSIRSIRFWKYVTRLHATHIFDPPNISRKKLYYRIVINLIRHSILLITHDMSAAHMVYTAHEVFNPHYRFFCLLTIFRAEQIAARFRAPSARSPNHFNPFCGPAARAAIYPSSACASNADRGSYTY